MLPTCGSIQSVAHDTPHVCADLLHHAFREIGTTGACGEGQYEVPAKHELIARSFSDSTADPAIPLPRVVSFVSLGDETKRTKSGRLLKESSGVATEESNE